MRAIRPLRWLLRAGAFACVSVALAACAAPAPGVDAAQDTPATAAAPESAPPAATPESRAEAPRRTPGTKGPVRTGGPMPPVRVETPAADPGDVDASCRTDADCTVKNVGNCCGYYPACVNVDSKPDPQAVQAKCAKDGMASVCGFPEIASCSCRQGRCAAESSQVVQ